MNRINAQVNNIFEKRRKNYLPGLLLPKIFQYREKTRPNTCLFAMKIRINRYKAPTSLAILVVLLIIGFFCDCSDAQKQLQQAEANRKEISAVLYRNRYSEDSLKLLLKQYIDEENDFAVMLVYKQLGVFMRENSRFTEAINNHQEELALAMKLNDTIEIVQAYNNLGTDFRRIGSHGEASDYHYQALDYAEAYSQAHVPGVGMKNRVVSLNGIGNVGLTLGYYDHAEKYFRMALEDELKLKSNIGQAINYANIGAIFEERGQLDSAHAYYNKSLEHNRIAKSDMGIGLCLIHLGKLYEREQKYEKAKDEYIQAYDLMHQISDRWHWLEACISIARINLLDNNISEFEHYISLAEQTANEIKSPEHLAEIYLLKHDFDVSTQDFKKALEHYKLQSLMRDSVQGLQKTNRFIDVRLSYEQNKNIRNIQRIEAENKSKQRSTHLTLYFTLALSLVGIIITALLYYAYKQRVRSNKALKQLEQTRSDFFTNITHEFRTPLTVIKGFNDRLMSSKHLSEKEKHVYRSAIDRQSNNLLNLVNQLLDIAKLKSGKEAPNWKRGDIISYLRMSAETFKLFAKEKDVNLIFYSVIESQEMDFIPFYIDKIIGNLLSNAIKHTKEGDKIDFVVSKGQRPDTIKIKISDTGDGIPKSDLKRIFEMFYQSTNSQNESGNGIGLAFTKMMVEKMKGEIEVDSELGIGSSFIVTLPLKNNNLTNIEPLLEQKSSFSLSKIQQRVGTKETNLYTDINEEGNTNEQHIILIVEDNRDVNTYIKTILSEKYRVLVARNGEEGLKLAKMHIPDLVVTDMMMPVMDGTQLCCEMKQNIMLNHIPIVMLTAKSSDEDRIKGLRCGAEAYIKKPFDTEELFITIHNILESRKTLIEKFMESANNITTDTVNRAESEANLKYLHVITGIILTEMQNPDLNTAYLAERMSVSTSQLNRKMNGITGKSTLSYILHVKLNKAKKMLQETSLPMSEVAHECGFYDANYFSRIFKKEFGISPSQFQKIHV